jgi:tRNA pseudouridine55 synthase
MHRSQRLFHDGILLVDKKVGETSFSVVKKVRGVLGLKKVGHAGSLDPFATGLLIILLGQGTKLSSYLMAGEKAYQGTIHLGIETDTLDSEGLVTQVRDVPSFHMEQIQGVIQTFMGEVEQTPPIYSALKFKGKRAYALARQGMSVVLPKRMVRIPSIEILSVEIPEITIRIRCSGGTYIRSLAADIGSALGTGAYLKSLRRLSSGHFHVKDAIESDSIQDLGPYEDLAVHMISLNDSLPGIKELRVDDPMSRKIRNGYRPRREDVLAQSDLFDDYAGLVKLVNGSTLIAIMEVKQPDNEDRDWVKKIRVFH